MAGEKMIQYTPRFSVATAIHISHLRKSVEGKREKKVKNWKEAYKLLEPFQKRRRHGISDGLFSPSPSQVM